MGRDQSICQGAGNSFVRSEKGSAALYDGAKIKSIYWERIFLRLELSPVSGEETQADALAFYVADVSTGKCCGTLTTGTVESDAGSLIASLNVTNKLNKSNYVISSNPFTELANRESRVGS